MKKENAAMVFGSMVSVAAIIALLVLSLTACGDDETADDDGTATDDDTETADDTLGDCADGFAGTPTAEVVENGTCSETLGDETIETVIVFASYDCTDGSKLYWADAGWGHEDSEWHDHGQRDDGQLIPVQDEIDACLRG